MKPGLLFAVLVLACAPAAAQRTHKPPLHAESGRAVSLEVVGQGIRATADRAASAFSARVDLGSLADGAHSLLAFHAGATGNSTSPGLPAVS